ncbi:16696_t:CDS:1, partial [Acaulospora colombiana]
DLGNERLREVLHGVRILSLELDERSIDRARLVSMMPNLRAFRIKFSYKNSIYDFSPLSSCQAHLTNLELSGLTWTSFRRHFPPLIPRIQSLQYLYLLLSYMEKRGFNEVAILKRWRDMKALYDRERRFMSYVFGEFKDLMKTDLKFFDIEGIEIRDS